MKILKFNKKLISILTVACLIFTTAYAAFPDVPSEQYNWAVDSINEMADMSIIKGYNDGTFRPSKAISKLEGLVLISRILGSNDTENETFIEQAIENYGSLIDGYDLGFGDREIAYLLLKGVISTDELDGYISEDNRDFGLKRYEIAILLTKALDAEENLSSSSVDYADASEIPSQAAKYVKYVTDQKIMTGMNGNIFSPNSNVTRAQAAVVLKKLLDKTEYSFESATVSDMNTLSGIIEFKKADGSSFSYTLLPNVILRYNGEKITKNEIISGYSAVVTYKNTDTIYSIDFTPSSIDTVLYGSLSSISTTGGATSIGVNVLNEDAITPAENSTAYKLSSDVIVTYNGETTGINNIKKGSYLKFSVSGDKVKVIEAFDKTTNVSGVVTGIVYSPVFKINVTDKNGDEIGYMFTNSATVTRNGKTSDASSLKEGDSVSLTLNYERITKVVATSKKSSTSGVITQIIISKNPKLTLTIDGEDLTYPLSTNATYSISGVEGGGDIYSLRTNTVATVNIEGNTITKISTTTATESKVITGKVLSVTPSANVFQISHVDALTGVAQADTVVVASTTKIFDTNGKAQRLSALSIGDSVTVYGTIGSGIVSASTVMIIN